MTQSTPVQVWFAAIVLSIVAGLALSGSVAVGTGAMLFALSLALLAIGLRLWPGAHSLTVAKVLHGTDRRS